MRIALSLLFLMLLAFASSSSAQNGKERTLSISAGLNKYANKDRLVSPFVYTANSYPVYLGYEVEHSNYIRSFEISYFQGTATTRTENTRDTHSGYMRFGYLRPVFQPSDHFSLNAGARIAAELLIDQNSFATLHQNYKINSSGYLALNTGLTANLEYRLNRNHSIELAPYISVLGYIYRPGYSLYHPTSIEQALENTNFGSYGKFLNTTASLGYQYRVSEQIKLSLNYKLNYLRYAKPFEVRVLQNSMALGVAVTL